MRQVQHFQQNLGLILENIIYTHILFTGGTMGMDSHGHSRASSRAGRIKDSKRARSRSTDHINNVQQHTGQYNLFVCLFF